MEQFLIYKLSNKINDKIYIGQTKKSLKERARSGYGYQGCRHLYSAIQKYGWENFYYTILAICSSEEQANIQEQYWIKYYDTTNPEKGYNISAGGTIRSDSEETKIKISNSVKKLWENPEYRKHQIKMNKQSWTAEKRLKQRGKLAIQREKTDFQKKALEGSKKYYNSLSQEQKNFLIEKRVASKRKKVYCETTNEIFLSQAAACKKYNIDPSSLSKACNGKLKHAGFLPGTKIPLSWKFYQNNQ